MQLWAHMAVPLAHSSISKGEVYCSNLQHCHCPSGNLKTLARWHSYICDVHRLTCATESIVGKGIASIAGTGVGPSCVDTAVLTKVKSFIALIDL